MKARRVRILGTGKALPKAAVSAEKLGRRIGVSAGWIERHSGVVTRHFAENETASQLGAEAAWQALRNAGLELDDIDCLVCASGTVEQLIPCTAALIHRALAAPEGRMACFDVNATCLSFVTALDMLSYAIEAGRYERVLLVSTEIASAGLDWRDKESCSIFGDGAAAVVIGRSAPEENSGILASAMETHSTGAALTEYRGSGTRQPARTYDPEHPDDFLFKMDGRGVFRLASRLMPPFFEALLEEAALTVDDLALVIPHQASLMSMRLIRKRLGIPEEKFWIIAENHGNTIAASIPMGLHEAIVQARIQRGDRVMLLGTSAGFSMGGLIFEY